MLCEQPAKTTLTARPRLGRPELGQDSASLLVGAPILLKLIVWCFRDILVTSGATAANGHRANMLSRRPGDDTAPPCSALQDAPLFGRDDLEGCSAALQPPPAGPELELELELELVAGVGYGSVP